MTHFAYRSVGLDIDAEFPCPGLEPAITPAFGRPVRVVTGAVPETLANPICSRPLTWIDRAGTALHRLPGIARFMVRRGHIVVAAESGTNATRLPGFLYDLPLLLQVCQWGLLPLDAACIALADGAVLLGGPPAVGRTTLALAIAAQGGRVIADKWCAMDATNPAQLRILPTAPHTSVWPNNPLLTDLVAPRDAEPAQLNCNNSFSANPIPVRMLVWLQPAANLAAPEWRQGARAFETVMRFSRSPELTRTLLGDRPRLATMMAIAASSKVLIWPYGPTLGTPANQASHLLKTLRTGNFLNPNNPSAP